MFWAPAEKIIFLYLILNLFYRTFVRLAHCKWPCSMYLFIYNKKEAGELMTKQNQVDITIHKVSTSHAYFHYKPELSINTKHIHKCTHTHTHKCTHAKVSIFIYPLTHLLKRTTCWILQLNHFVILSKMYVIFGPEKMSIIKQKLILTNKRNYIGCKDMTVN